MRRTSPRRGTLLVMVLGLIMVLSAFGMLVKMLSQQAYREVDAVTQHLRAVAVGEAAYATVVSRLAATPWAQRWFRTAPDVQRDVAAADGTYSYLLRDAPASATIPARNLALTSPGAHQAELLVRSTYGKSSVTLFWRLILPEHSLESAIRVLPIFFTFAPGDGAPAPGRTDEISTLVDDLLRRRERNTDSFDPLRGPLGQAPGPGEIGGVLGHIPAGPVVAGVPRPDGGSGSSSGTRQGTDRGKPPELPPELRSAPPPATPIPMGTDPSGTSTLFPPAPGGTPPVGGIQSGAFASARSLADATILIGNLTGEIFYADMAPAGKVPGPAVVKAEGQAALDELRSAAADEPLPAEPPSARLLGEMTRARAALAKFKELQKYP